MDELAFDAGGLLAPELDIEAHLDRLVRVDDEVFATAGQTELADHELEIVTWDLSLSSPSSRTSR